MCRANPVRSALQDCLKKERAAPRPHFSFTWSGSSSHRWWTNVLFEAALHKTGFIHDPAVSFLCCRWFENQQPTSTLVANMISSICLWCNTTKERDLCLLYCIFQCVWSRVLAKPFYSLTSIDWRSLATGGWREQTRLNISTSLPLTQLCNWLVVCVRVK